MVSGLLLEHVVSDRGIEVDMDNHWADSSSQYPQKEPVHHFGDGLRHPLGGSKGYPKERCGDSCRVYLLQDNDEIRMSFGIGE